MDEARKVIQRLERIEALQSAQAPATRLLAEVRQLLREGEAWLAVEHDGARAEAVGAFARETAAEATAGAAAALKECRTTLARREEVVSQTTESAVL